MVGHRFQSAPSVLSFFLATVSISTNGAPAEDFAYFEKHIRPVLVEHCQSCHSGAAEKAGKLKGGLRVDLRDSLRKGGNSGKPSVVPGKPEQSLLLTALSHGNSDLQMPPKNRLPEATLARFREWIQMGAPDPRDGQAQAAPAAKLDLAKAREFWSLKPPVEPTPPVVKNRAWAKSPLDPFILAKLEAAGLAPAAAADKRALIRRAAYDLTGLPPAMEEVQAFLADNSPDAFSKVVDRLLASPRYGEKWGRHWLDIARYADSNGMDENLAYIQAWRYRNYVIDAFNTDKPYGQFVREQIAGDLIPAAAGESPTRAHERMVATGFLCIGPKMLAEDDGRKMEMDIVDEQIDTMGRAFLGLSLGCARCHDHKFDPVTARDYYALAGFFKSTKTMENFSVVAVWHERELLTPPLTALRDTHRSLLAAQQQVLVAQVAKFNQQILVEKSLAELPAKPEESYSETMRKELAELRATLARLEKTAPDIPRAMAVSDGTTQDLRVHVRGNYLTLGEPAPRALPQVFDATRAMPTNSSGRLQLAEWLAQPDHPLTARVMVNRLWHWHFGEGIVRTPDDFGRQGDAPTHPELLDWLARRFVASGFSMKAMHRLVMNSATYQMGAGFDAKASARDPDNRLRWRFARRRLQAEEVRDSILFAAGILREGAREQLLTHKPREYVTATGPKNVRFEFDSRSVYLPVVRSAMYEVMAAFDFGDPAVVQGRRASTTVAPQALFMMNSELVQQAGQKMASELGGAVAKGDDERVRLLYRRLFQREPVAQEIQDAAAHLAACRAVGAGAASAEAELRAWQSWVRVLLGTNEFIFVD